MRKLLAIPTTVLAIALSVSACGSDGQKEKGPGAAGSSAAPSSSAPAASTPSSGAPAAGGSGGGGGQQGSGGSGGGASNAQHAKMIKTAECMRSKGYEVEDPKPGQLLVFKNVAPKDQNKANADLQTCRSKAGLTPPK